MALPVNKYYCVKDETVTVMFNVAPSLDAFCTTCKAKVPHRRVDLKGKPDPTTAEVSLFNAPSQAASVKLDASVSAELPVKESPRATVQLDVQSGSIKSAAK